MSKVMYMDEEYAGLPTPMSTAEVEAGTIEDGRTISPKVLHDYVGESIEPFEPIGDVYTATWKASSSSAVNTNLTNSVNLPAGTYLLIAHTPILSSSLLVCFNVVSPPYRQVETHDMFFTVVTLSQASEVCLQSAASASVSFTYTDRGRLIAVRLK